MLFTNRLLKSLLKFFPFFSHLPLASTSFTKAIVKVDEVGVNMKQPIAKALRCQVDVEVMGKTTTCTVMGCWCGAIFVGVGMASIEWHCQGLMARLVAMLL